MAVSLAAKEDGIADALILSGAAAIRPKNSIKRMFFLLIAKAGKVLFRLPFIEKFSVLARKVLYGLAGSRDYENTTGIKKEIFKKIVREDSRNLLPKIKIPTLVLWGEKDKYVPLKYGKKIHKLIPGSAMYIVKDGGHGLHIKNIKEIELIINEFISHV